MKRHETKELKSALSFTVNQIKKGYSPLEAFEQVENAYGLEFRVKAQQAFRAYFNK